MVKYNVELMRNNGDIMYINNIGVYEIRNMCKQLLELEYPFLEPINMSKNVVHNLVSRPEKCYTHLSNLITIKRAS